MQGLRPAAGLHRHLGQGLRGLAGRGPRLLPGVRLGRPVGPAFREQGLWWGEADPRPCSGPDPAVGAPWLGAAGGLRDRRGGRRVPSRAPESRYVGFGNTAPPPKKDEDFLNSAMSSLYSVSPPAPREPLAPSGGRPVRPLRGRLRGSLRPQRVSRRGLLGQQSPFQLTRRVSSKETSVLCGLVWPPLPGERGWPDPAPPCQGPRARLARGRPPGLVAEVTALSCTLWGRRPHHAQPDRRAPRTLPGAENGGATPAGGLRGLSAGLGATGSPVRFQAGRVAGLRARPRLWARERRAVGVPLPLKKQQKVTVLPGSCAGTGPLQTPEGPPGWGRLLLRDGAGSSRGCVKGLGGRGCLREGGREAGCV